MNTISPEEMTRWFNERRVRIRTEPILDKSGALVDLRYLGLEGMDDEVRTRLRLAHQPPPPAR